MKLSAENAPDNSSKRALAIVGAFALARCALMLALGLGSDETYTVVISRKLALSYFDHPPLHQWIAHFAALAFGETVWVRLPFIALFAATGWLCFVLTRDLFGARAGMIALVALNLSPFFLVSGGGWVVPDGPLLFFLSAGALALTRLFFGAPDRRSRWTLWLTVGAAFGLAGLSKYGAALTALGVVAFIACAPSQRRWLRDPAPYVAALLAFALISPVVVWNAEHGWVSFLFQGMRAVPAEKWRPLQFPAMALGEIAYLTPWIFAALAGALIAALRGEGRPDEKRLFLACLALPPILLFTLTPLWGPRGYPHWAMSGWLFAYPLMGAWLAAPWARQWNLRRWAAGTAALLALAALVAGTQAATGWIERLAGPPRQVRDLTLEMLDWTPVLAAPSFQTPHEFIVATDWPDAAKLMQALGPGTPVFLFSEDPRGMAAFNDSARFIGKDALIVVPRERLAATLVNLKGYFDRIDPPQFFSFGRGGQNEIELALAPAHGLTRAFPVPYPL